MGEVVNVLVAFAVIVFLFRWVTSGTESTEQRSAAEALGFRPKNVTQEMVQTISNMFPDIPVDNIRFALLKTGSVELTTNTILERGYLDPPPPSYYTLYPRQPAEATARQNAAPGGPQATAGSLNIRKQPKAESLIHRFHLEDRVQEAVPDVELEQVGGKAVWEDNAEKREASLRERKAKMVLAARQRLIAKQQKAAEK